VCLIGIGDVPCRIVAKAISKAILYVIGDDIALAAGPLPLAILDLAYRGGTA